MTWTSPKAPTMTLAGFRSRWITPRLWAYPTASATSSKMPRKRLRSSANEARDLSSESRVCPLTSFMAKNGRPSASVPSS